MKIISHTVKPKIPEALAAARGDGAQPLAFLEFRRDHALHPARLRCLAPVAPESGQDARHGAAGALRRAAADDSYLAALKRSYEQVRALQERRAWYKGDYKDSVAYFSMEYGMDSSLPIYSGGLGILSGDHMKTSSDMGLPLVGVGLLYRQGYFKQYLNADGFQQESYPENDWYNMPVRRCETAKGEPVKIAVEMAGEQIVAQIWEVKVGRSSLYLLDTNIEENAPPNRVITATLYGGDKETRIRQEILLGVGGIRALRALGINPAVTHMNEGHSAFLGLERIREIMADRGFPSRRPRRRSGRRTSSRPTRRCPRATSASASTSWRSTSAAWAQQLGLDWKDFLALGRERPERRRRALLHDRPCPQALGLRQRRVGAPRRRVARDVEGDLARPAHRRGADRLRDQRRPPAHLDLAHHARAPRPLLRAALLRGARQPRHLGPHRPHLRRGALAHPRAPPRAPRRLRPRPAQEGRCGAWASRRRAWPAPRTPSRPTRSPSPSRAASRPTSAATSSSPTPTASSGSCPTRTGPSRSSSRARPIRTTCPARRSSRSSSTSRAATMCRPHRLPRGLRHDDGPLHDLRLRRLAQHAAPPPRGLGHERHEGRHERRAQLLRPRRLVGRGLHAPSAAGPSARARSTRTRSSRTRSRRGPLRPPRARDRPALLRARPRRPAPRVDQEDEVLHPKCRQEFLLPQNPDGIHRPLLSARA